MLETLKDVGLLLSLAINVYLVWFIGRRSRPESGRSPPTGGVVAPRAPGPLSEADVTRVREVFRSAGIISAIKLYRELTGAGLADAKRAVESIGPN